VVGFRMSACNQSLGQFHSGKPAAKAPALGWSLISFRSRLKWVWN
jgi:hypothetical protein